jgi:hypothetical protein
MAGVKAGLMVDLGKGRVQGCWYELTQAEVGEGQVCCVAENTHLSGTSEADRDGPKLLDCSCGCPC